MHSSVWINQLMSVFSISMICQPCCKAPSFMGYRRLSTMQVSNTCASFIATLKLNAHLVSQVTSNINFENDLLLKRCLYASRSFSLGSMSHSLVFENCESKDDGSTYVTYMRLFWIKQLVCLMKKNHTQ
jgi:hypothetical protein